MNPRDTISQILQEAAQKAAKLPELEVSTTCLSCGEPYAFKVSELNAKSFVCTKCGGKLDEKPLLLMAREGLSALWEAVRKKAQQL